MRIPQRLTQAAIVLVALSPLWTGAAPHARRHGQSRASATPSKADCEISGVVVDAATGGPIEGAQVIALTPPSGVMGDVIPVALAGSPCDRCDVFGSPRYQAVTDARGRFAIPEVFPGQYKVKALASGYAGQFYPAKEQYSFPNTFFLRAGEKRDDVRIQLPRQAVLSGRVVDENGEPVVSAYVQLMQYGAFGANQNSLEPVTSAVTDDRGEYRLFELPPGRYYIQARYEPGFDLSPLRPSDVAERFVRPRRGFKTFSPSFYYPGATEPTAAKPIEASAGQSLTGLDISVRPLTPVERARLFPERFKTPLRGDCQVSGVVTSAASGRPMDHAWVFLGPANGAMRPPIAMVSTDAEGRFDFRGLSCDWAPQPLLAWKEGFVEKYQPAAININPPGSKSPFPPRPRITHVNISLAPAGVMTGRITNAQGGPAACVRVVLTSRADPNDRRWLSPFRETTTDDRGRYRFYQLPAGRYYVAAQIQPSNAVATQTTAAFPASATPASGATFALPYVYYPGASSGEGAKAIRVEAGELVKVTDFSVTPETTYSVRGVVGGPALAAVNRGLTVVLAPANGPYGLPLPVHESPLDASGTFQIDGVEPGSYVLWAMAFIRDQKYAAWAPVTVGRSSVAGITLEPHPGWSVAGHLNVENAPRQSVRYEISAEQQDDPLAPQTAIGGEISPNGSFELKGLFPGRYLIRVAGWPVIARRPVGERSLPAVTRPSNMYIKSAKLGTQVLPDFFFNVSTEPPTGTLDLTVDWDGAQIEGTVVNSRGEPVESADVVLIPENRDRLTALKVKATRPYLHGRFLIPAVPPGEYRSFAWRDVSQGAWLDPDFLNSQWKRGVILKLSEGEAKSLRLRVLDAAVPAVRRSR